MNETTVAAPPMIQAENDPDELMCKNLMGVCRQCLLISFFKSEETSVKSLQNTKCPQCQQGLWMPEEVMRFLSLFGYYVPKKVGSCLLFSAMRVPPVLMPHFIASFANAFTDRLQTDYTYDVAIPRGPEGLGMKIQKQGEHVVVGGFTPLSNGVTGAAKCTQKIGVGDILVAVNKDSVRMLTFNQQVELMSRAASPLYLTFLRATPMNTI